jgi:hypothetical protein
MGNSVGSVPNRVQVWRKSSPVRRNRDGRFSTWDGCRVAFPQEKFPVASSLFARLTLTLKHPFATDSLGTPDFWPHPKYCAPYHRGQDSGTPTGIPLRRRLPPDTGAGSQVMQCVTLFLGPSIPASYSGFF